MAGSGGAGVSRRPSHRAETRRSPRGLVPSPGGEGDQRAWGRAAEFTQPADMVSIKVDQ
jgi:hypothetical protein